MAFTFFFRDSSTLETAIQEALPGLQGRSFIRVWDAGCAHGPEPYTLAILLRERMSEYVFRNVSIHATDVELDFGSQVTAGVFPEHEVKRVPADIFRKYFRPAAEPGFVEVISDLRAKVAFAHHDLLSLRPIREGFSMIVCKNVLLHFDEAQRCKVLHMFHESLQPSGILVMEQTQKLPEGLTPLFDQVAPCGPIYRKVDRKRVQYQADDRVPAPHRRSRTEVANVTLASAISDRGTARSLVQ